MIATYVTIRTAIYRLGQTSSRDSKIGCIAPDGLVHRVCHWQPGGIEVGTRIYTSGEYLHYHCTPHVPKDAVYWERIVRGSSSGDCADDLIQAAVKMCVETDVKGAPCGSWHALATVAGTKCHCYWCCRDRGEKF